MYKLGSFCMFQCCLLGCHPAQISLLFAEGCLADDVIDPSCCLGVVVCSAFCLPCNHLVYCIPWVSRRSHSAELFPRFVFSRLMAAAYSALDTRYCTFLPTRCSGLSFLRSYLRLFAFTSFLCNVRHEFHHGTHLCRGSFLDVSLVCLNEDRHA